MERGSGIFLPISALPSKYGIGTFSKEAKKFVKILKIGGQKYWQLLPINPINENISPYHPVCAFAINPYFIDLDELKRKHLLSQREIDDHTKNRNDGKIDYGFLAEHRYTLLFLAAQRLLKLEKSKIDNFYRKHKYWLKDYASFLTLKKITANSSWKNWEKSWRNHQKKDLEMVIEKNIRDFNTFVAIQYLAYNQYFKLKKYANARGVYLIGELPFYVDYESSDCWAHSKEFMLDNNKNPISVAGVPPDYFSLTGQLWGNPVYNFEIMQKNNFKWWNKRIAHASKLYDVICLHYFRGFASFYAVDSGSETAKYGKWISGPGKTIIDKFNFIAQNKIVIDDLTNVSQDFLSLKDYANYPGLKVFQYAFDGNPYNPHLPHLYEKNSLAYLNTKDNELMSIFLKNNYEIKEAIKYYLNSEDDNNSNLIDASIKCLMNSRANITIFMPQDLLNLDENTRINIPEKKDRNWLFRLKKAQFKKEMFYKLYDWACTYNRY